MEKKILIFPRKDTPQKKNSIKAIEASFDVQDARLLELSLIETKTKHTVISPLHIPSFSPQSFGKPYLFFDKKSEIIPKKTKNQWKCERWKTIEKKGASSFRFFLHNEPHQPHQKINLELTYTINWLNHLVINYRLTSPQTQHIMIPHPIPFATKNPINTRFSPQNIVLWHEWKKNQDTTRCAFVLKENKDDPLQLKRVACWTTKSKKKDLTIEMHTAARAAECAFTQPRDHNHAFWVNAFDFHIDNKHREIAESKQKKLAEKSEKIGDDTTMYTTQFPFKVKETKGFCYHYSTLFYFRLS